MQIKKIDINLIDEIFLISFEQFQKESWTKQQFAECLNDSNYVCFGIFENDKLISYVLALESLDDVNILSIATKEKYKNKGFASALLEHLKKYSKLNNKTLSLEVKSKNHVAINLYTKLGFKIVSSRLNYYKDKDTAIIMFYM